MASEAGPAAETHSDYRRNGLAYAPAAIAAAILISFAVLFCIAVRWYRPGQVIGLIDFFPNFSPLILFQKTVFAWSDAGSPFGSFDFPTFSVYYLAQYALAALTNTGMAQILMFWSFMAAGWLGAFVLARRIGLGVPAAFLAAWTYELNPYSQFLVPFITGSALAAAFPWVLWMLYVGATDVRSRPRMTAIAAAASFLVFPLIASTPQIFFELFLVAAAWCAFLLRRAERGFLAWLGWTLGASLLAAAWWLFPVLFALFGNSIARGTESASWAWSFANSSLLNNLRFISAWTWSYPYYIPYAHDYDANPAIYAAGFWGAIVLCIGLILKRSPRAPFVRFFAVLTVVAIFIAKGPHPPLEQLNAVIYKIPGFFLLIQPGGLTAAALLALCLVLGIVLDDAFAAFAAKTRLGWIGLPLLLGGTLAAAPLSALPLLDGDLFGSLEGGAVRNYATLPAYWRQASDYLNSVPGDGSVLVLPSDRTYQALYDWGYQGVDVIPMDLVRRPVFMLGASLGYLTDSRLEIFKHQIDIALQIRSPGTAQLLSSLGVRFILCRKDVVQGQAWLSQEGDCRARFLARNAIVREFGKIVVYDLRGNVAQYDLAKDKAPPVPLNDRTVLGFAHVVTIPPQTAGATLSDRQFFAPTWAALTLRPRLSILPHLPVDWHNGWTLNGEGVVVAFNVANALEVLFAAIGAAVVVASALAAVWRR